MFNYKAFADEMSKQSKELIPADFSEKEKKYISTTICNFVKLAGESLNNDKENAFSDEQKVFIAQVIAEWTFHKSVDLIRAEISDKYWDGIMQKIAFTIFEVIKQAIIKEIPKEQVLEAVEHHVKKVYKECIEELFTNDKITEEIKDIAIEQSNIDTMAEEAGFQTEEIVEKEENFRKSCFNFLKGFIIDYLKIFFALLSVLFVLTLFLKYKNLLLNINMWQIVFVIVLIVLCVIAVIYFTGKAEIKHQEKELADVKQKMNDLVNPNKFYDRLGVDVISLQVGQGLLCIADPDQEGLLLAKLAALRQRLTDNYGYIIPNVRIMDSTKLKENEYVIAIRSNVVDEGFVYPNKYMIIADKWEATGKAVPEDVIIADDPTYKVKAYWVDADIAIEKKDMHAIAPDDVIIQHLEEVLIQQVDKVLSEKDIRKCIDLVKEDNSVSTDSLLTKLSYGDIRQVYVNLIREKVSVRDITLLLSRLDDYSRYHKEPDILSELIRKDFSRQISLVHCNNDKKIYAIDLSQELTIKLLECVELQKEFNKTKLSLDKQSEHDLIENIAIKLMETHKRIGTQPIILCDEKLRLALYRLLVKHIPTVVVLATNEIETDIKLEIVDTL